MTPKGEKGNGRTHERRTGVDRRIADDPAYEGAERRRSGLRRRTDRSPDKPIKR
jgi:hypothetical protein